MGPLNSLTLQRAIGYATSLYLVIDPNKILMKTFRRIHISHHKIVIDF